MEPNLTVDRKKFIAVTGAIVVLAGVGGILIGRATDQPAATATAVEEGGPAGDREIGRAHV